MKALIGLMLALGFATALQGRGIELAEFQMLPEDEGKR
jgi:hypothetical protein